MENVFTAFAVAPLGGALLVAVVGFLFALVVGSGYITGNVVGMAFIATALAGYAAAIIPPSSCFAISGGPAAPTGCSCVQRSAPSPARSCPLQY